MYQIFGDFKEDLPATEHEFLQIGFSPSSVPLQQRWRNNGLSADFVADYLATFFLSGDNTLGPQDQIPSGSGVAYGGKQAASTPLTRRYNHFSNCVPVFCLLSPSC